MQFAHEAIPGHAPHCEVYWLHLMCSIPLHCFWHNIRSYNHIKGKTYRTEAPVHLCGPFCCSQIRRLPSSHQGREGALHLSPCIGSLCPVHACTCVHVLVCSMLIWHVLVWHVLVCSMLVWHVLVCGMLVWHVLVWHVLVCSMLTWHVLVWLYAWKSKVG